jgi:hypothetical protein
MSWMTMLRKPMPRCSPVRTMCSGIEVVASNAQETTTTSRVSALPPGLHS